MTDRASRVRNPRKGTRKRTGAGKEAGRPPRQGWPEVYKWLATGTLVVYTAVGSKTVPVLQAQQPGGNASSGGSHSQTLVVRQFDITAGPLGEVLKAYTDATGLQVTFAGEAIRTIQSPGVSGLYTNRQALQQLLKDTGVAAR